MTSPSIDDNSGAQKKLMIGRGEGEAIFRGSIRFGFFFFLLRDL